MFCAILGLILLTILVYNAGRRVSLAAHGATVEGVVTGRSATRGKSTSYTVWVGFELDGEIRSTRFAVDWSTYDASEYGTPFPVFVDRTDPTNNAPGTVTGDDVVRWTAAWGAGWLLGAGLAAFGFAANHRAALGEVEMLRDWPASSLSVLSVTAVPGKVPSITVGGFYLDEKGRRIDVSGLSLATTVRTDQPLPILYGPAYDRAVPLETLKRAELF